ncbi:phenylalanine--tRNA ligase subunit beta [Hydrocarboniclastica marina]|uniref:Phenylalanine--tRNA ligase beta subunit n=1 Tax=Hydrocarboniclastica marina TaxID=2259620 RepID=A0A4P7XEQ9_9ALTE|nr:phenylalanine--tRNA ligase subunit beta [Hydrocarboniclastica marina]QCF25429.1 phenylalanine--tRNA ligase subunit beta [Hydrocarboniclastica marina]
MKFSEQWLRTWVNPDIDTATLAHQITMAGLEVDDVLPAAGQFSNVVVGHVEAVRPHPDADKLNVCEVSDGKQVVQVVCGAPNVRPGLKVPFAVLGAELPGDFKIRKAKLRGVESTGMLCSARELGLSEDHAGLMELASSAPTGTDLREYLGLDDAIIDVDLTPNRSDCLSIRGLAREVGVLNQLAVEGPEIEPVPAQHDDLPDIRIAAPEACPRYIGRIIRNVNVKAESPLWMKERLRRSGIRSIDPVVDVTNYVMLELGQPMHAFDLNNIRGGIVVRMAGAGEKLVLLDGQEVTLNEQTLVIADHERSVAIAGIMGGEDSGVNPETRDILLESAFFAPLCLAGKARSFGLHTESSHRFERGVDPELQRIAAERATALLLDIVGGEPGELVEVHSSGHTPQKRQVALREARVNGLLGTEIDRTEVEEILTRLGLHIVKLTRDGWLVSVPSFRFDISIEEDLIEEIGRVHGYNNLPVTTPVGGLGLRLMPEKNRPLSRVQDHLVSLGYQEVVTYSFVDSRQQQQVDPGEDAIALANPISSDMDVMRTSLWPGLLRTAAFNQNRQQQHLRMFETGLRFRKQAGEIEQEPMLAGLIVGRRRPENWANDKQSVDFYDMKGELESLFEVLGISPEWTRDSHPSLHPGQSARLVLGGETIGWAGALHPQLQKAQEVNGACYIFELCLTPVLTGYVPNFKEFSKFPEVRRDLAIIVSKEVSWREVEARVLESAGEHLTGLRVFDVYGGGAIGEDKQSLAISLFWQHPERTLQDEEVQAVFESVIAHVREQLHATLRS